MWLMQQVHQPPQRPLERLQVTEDSPCPRQRELLSICVS